MENFQQSIKEFALNFLNFAVVLVIGVVAVKLLLMLIKRVLGKTSLDRTVKSFLFSVVRVLLYAVVVVTALGTARVDISSLLTALGAAALTASLALQDTLKNFVSGMIILFNKPFTSGDWIQVDGCEGKIDCIRIFYTQLHTFDNRVQERHLRCDRQKRADFGGAGAEGLCLQAPRQRRGDHGVCLDDAGELFCRAVPDGGGRQKRV